MIMRTLSRTTKSDVFNEIYRLTKTWESSETMQNTATAVMVMQEVGRCRIAGCTQYPCLPRMKPRQFMPFADQWIKNSIFFLVKFINAVFWEEERAYCFMNNMQCFKSWARWSSKAWFALWDLIPTCSVEEIPIFPTYRSRTILLGTPYSMLSLCKWRTFREDIMNGSANLRCRCKSNPQTNPRGPTSINAVLLFKLLQIILSFSQIFFGFGHLFRLMVQNWSRQHEMDHVLRL